jgi:mono/diheme cytochrome c family protein
MTPRRRLALLLGLAVVAVAGAVTFASAYLAHGLSARDRPLALEAFAARRLRHLAIPRGACAAPNPLPRSPGLLAEARAHFADHCASCHANDGSGATEIGQNLYPKAPDMRLAPTQDLSDGEIFYIIENGIRFTGMPAWATGTPEGKQESWGLVHFIRHLPQLTGEELAAMKHLNPVSPAELKEREEEEKFLRGEDTAAAPTHPR